MLGCFTRSVGGAARAKPSNETVSLSCQAKARVRADLKKAAVRLPLSPTAGYELGVKDGPKPNRSAAISPDFMRPSRRELLTRLGATAAVLGGSAAAGVLLRDKGSFGLESAEGARQVRDYRDPGVRKDTRFAELAIAKGTVEPESAPPSPESSMSETRALCLSFEPSSGT